MLWTKLTDFSNFLFELPHKVFHKISLPNSLISSNFILLSNGCVCTCFEFHVPVVSTKYTLSLVNLVFRLFLFYCLLLFSKANCNDDGTVFYWKMVQSPKENHGWNKLFVQWTMFICDYGMAQILFGVQKSIWSYEKTHSHNHNSSKKKQFIIPVGLNSSGIHTPIQYYDIDYVFSMISVVLFTNSHFGFSFANVINILLHFPWKSEYFDFFHKANSPNQCRCVIKILI